MDLPRRNLNDKMNDMEKRKTKKTKVQVVEDLKLELGPLREVSEIIQADWQSLKLLRTVRMFLESDNINGRRIIKCAVIDAGKP